MPSVLLDQNAPRGLRKLLTGHDVKSAYQMGWDTLQNGELIAVAEAARFDVLVTADQNIEHQQNLTDRKLAIVVLGTNHWPIVRANADQVVRAVNEAKAGSYQAISFDRPPLRRRRLPRPSIPA
jgi:hypothetical protein